MKPKIKILLIISGSLLVTVLAPFVGMNWIGPEVLTQEAGSSTDALIFWRIRAPRTLMAFLAGAALALGGAAFQALFRNPLATPYTLGVSSGAALGAVLMIRIGGQLSLLGFSGTAPAAFLGALGAIGAVYCLAVLAGGLSSVRLLLAGVAVSLFFSSLVLAVQYSANLYDSFRLIRWLMGGLAASEIRQVLQLAPIVLVGSVVIFLTAHSLDHLLTGEQLAQSRGISVKTIRHILLVTVSLMVGGVVAFCGPIGFIGLMAPHFTRLIVGPRHWILLPATFFVGGAFLVLCDTAARTVMAPSEIPVGIITALLGGPFFLLLLVIHSRTHR